MSDYKEECERWRKAAGRFDAEQIARLVQAIGDPVEHYHRPEEASSDHPIYRKVEEDHGATPTFMIVCDEGWRESIFCEHMYGYAADWLVMTLDRQPFAGVRRFLDTTSSVMFQAGRDLRPDDPEFR